MYKFIIIMAIDWDIVLDSLNVAWKGMLGLFVAMGFIFLSMILLNKLKLDSKKKSDEDNG